MSLEILEIIKKHISDALGTELLETNASGDGVGFNVYIDGKTTHIFISTQFVRSIENSDSIAESLKSHDILTFIRENPGRSISLNSSGPEIDSIDR